MIRVNGGECFPAAGEENFVALPVGLMLSDSTRFIEERQVANPSGEMYTEEGIS